MFPSSINILDKILYSQFLKIRNNIRYFLVDILFLQDKLHNYYSISQADK